MSFDEQSIDLDLVPTEKLKIYELPNSREKLNYSKFITNNWLKPDSENKTLKAIEEKGGGLWLGHDGIIRFRVRQDEDIMSIESEEQARRAISVFLEREKVRLFKGVGTGRDSLPPEIYIHDLISAKDLFTPFSLSEFYISGGVWYRSNFRPTDYISKKSEQKGDTSPDTILGIIKNLSNNNAKQYEWILNWLAGFFQTLKKSQVSLVLRGDQGSGKGIFFTKIITPLFGKDYCITVDSGNLESNFKNWIDGRLFLNLNEVAVDMKGRRNVKNFLKQLVTDEYVNVETKFKDAAEKRIYANVLITSNEAFPIEVEPSDRRFTIFQTGKGLKVQGWDMDRAIENIQGELSSFAEYLGNYKVDWALYNTAMDTPEKQAIVDGTTSQVRRYLHAIINHDLSFFTDFDEDKENNWLYINLKLAFQDKKISQSLLYDAFEKLYDTKKSAKKFTSETRNLNPDYFGRDKLKKSGNLRSYEI